jgi:hypothetical protein
MLARWRATMPHTGHCGNLAPVLPPGGAVALVAPLRTNVGQFRRQLPTAGFLIRGLCSRAARYHLLSLGGRNSMKTW